MLGHCIDVYAKDHTLNVWLSPELNVLMRDAKDLEIVLGTALVAMAQGHQYRMQVAQTSQDHYTRHPLQDSRRVCRYL